MGTFQANDLVMFKNRCQVTTGGMRVEDVDANMFDTKIKVDGKWWSPESFITLDEWRENLQPARH